MKCKLPPIDHEQHAAADLIAGLALYAGWRAEHGKPERFTIAELYADLNEPGNERARYRLNSVLMVEYPATSFAVSAGRCLRRHLARSHDGMKLDMKLVDRKPFWRVARID